MVNGLKRYGLFAAAMVLVGVCAFATTESTSKPSDATPARESSSVSQGRKADQSLVAFRGRRANRVAYRRGGRMA